MTMHGKRLTIFFILILSVAFFSCDKNRTNGELPRQKVQFDLGWKFHKGEAEGASESIFDDSGWQTLDIPHDWSIHDTFSKDNPTGRPGGFASGGIGWYRKKFNLSRKDQGLQVSIEFGGVYENSEVWINGNYLGKRPFGYISFSYDLTPFLNWDGDNILAVRVDNSKQPNARWYTGSGIYRHVCLVKMQRTHIARHGVYVTTPEVSNEFAKMDISTIVENDSEDSELIELVHELISPDEEVFYSEKLEVEISGGNKKELLASIDIDKPKLWSPDSPDLYLLRTSIFLGNRLVDQLEMNVGVRYFQFDADSGFSLNGERMKIKGVNNHSDLGALGAAINDRVLERRLEILKDMGCNAIRTAHNPPCEELLDMCDRMGFMLMDEAFDEWLESWPFGGVKKPEGKAKYGYHLHFNEWAEKDLSELIRRDRNHPSVILWSVGNEIPDACFEIGAERLKRLMGVVKELDSSRPVTAGITHMHLANESGFASLLDVTGYNGGGGSAFMYEKDHKTYPERKMLATEVPHSFQTRGIYRTKSWYRGQNPLGGIFKVPDLTEDEVFPDVPKFYSSSYDNAMVRIGARDSWRRTRDFPFMAGEFRWTGYDYLGETMFGWPAKFWNFGVIDMCGFPKDTYYFYKSQWTEEPMVHILPHWNWEGLEGLEIPVVSYSNCESVELFLNDISLGEQVMGDSLDLLWKVPYQAGELKAVGKNQGRVSCEKKIVTSGLPARIELIADRLSFKADRRDVVHIEVNILDSDGNFVPYASNMMNFSLEGEGSIIAVDNGDPLCELGFSEKTRPVFNGKCLVIIKSTGIPGEIVIRAESEGLANSEIMIEAK